MTQLMTLADLEAILKEKDPPGLTLQKEEIRQIIIRMNEIDKSNWEFPVGQHDYRSKLWYKDNKSRFAKAFPKDKVEKFFGNGYDENDFEFIDSTIQYVKYKHKDLPLQFGFTQTTDKFTFVDKSIETKVFRSPYTEMNFQIKSESPPYLNLGFHYDDIYG